MHIPAKILIVPLATPYFLSAAIRAIGASSTLGSTMVSVQKNIVLRLAITISLAQTAKTAGHWLPLVVNARLLTATVQRVFLALSVLSNPIRDTVLVTKPKTPVQ